MHIEVAYSTSEQQVLLALSVVAGTTVAEAIYQSSIQKYFPDIDLSRNKVGIFGKIVSLTHVLAEGDRVEIYRPLLIDPKQARKSRAK